MVSLTKLIKFDSQLSNFLHTKSLYFTRDTGFFMVRVDRLTKLTEGEDMFFLVNMSTLLKNASNLLILKDNSFDNKMSTNVKGVKDEKSL